MSEGRTLLLTGVPRGGTTLACRLLGQAQATVALFEPIDVAHLPADPETAIETIADFAATARKSLRHDGEAPSKLHGGAVPDNPFGAPDPASGERRLLAAPGRLRLPAPPPADFTLVIKHNAAFLALLPALAGRFPVLAVVRHPLPVLASWQTVPLPVAEGRLPAAERLDPALARRLDRLDDRLARQLAILEWCQARIGRLTATAVVRYEDIVASGGQALFRAAGVTGAAPPLEDRNASPIYRRLPLEALAQAVRERGLGSPWYPPAELDRRLAALREDGAGA